MDAEERQNWAGRIKPERERQRMGRQALAAKAGVTLKTIANLERGDHVPQESKLLVVLDALGLEPHHDPLFDADLEALMTLVGTLVKRLPMDYRVEWAERVTVELIETIRKAIADVPVGEIIPDETDPSEREILESSFDQETKLQLIDRLRTLRRAHLDPDQSDDD